MLSVGAFLSAVIGVAGWGTRAGAVVVDTRYVHADTFHDYRLSERFRDSLATVEREAELREIRGAMARMDSNVFCLRHPKRRECAT